MDLETFLSCRSPYKRAQRTASQDMGILFSSMVWDMGEELMPDEEPHLRCIWLGIPNLLSLVTWWLLWLCQLFVQLIAILTLEAFIQEMDFCKVLYFHVYMISWTRLAGNLESSLAWHRFLVYLSKLFITGGILKVPSEWHNFFLWYWM